MVIVANANIDDGSAGRMADALSLAGFDTGPVVTSTEKLDRSVVFYVDTAEAAETARQVGEVMGGLPVLSLLDDRVWTESGTLDGGDVLVLLGQNEADRTLDDLNGGSGGGGSTTGGNNEPIGGTVECSESALRAGLEGFTDEIVSVDSFECQDGWAVVFLAVDGGTDDPGDTVAGVAVLEAEGQFWILKAQAPTCVARSRRSTTTGSRSAPMTPRCLRRCGQQPAWATERRHARVIDSTVGVELMRCRISRFERSAAKRV